MRRLLVRDPRKRPDAQSILKHEWLRGGGTAAPEAPMQPEILNRMKRFAGMNRFKKEALRVRQGSRGGLSRGLGPPCVLYPTLGVALVLHQVVATHLPPEEIEGIRQMFMDLDADGSGTISFEELREGAVPQSEGNQGPALRVGCVDCCSEQHSALPVRAAGLRRKGALVADGELQRIMAHVDLDGNSTLDFQVRAAALCWLQSRCMSAWTQSAAPRPDRHCVHVLCAGVPDCHSVPGQAAAA